MNERVGYVPFNDVLGYIGTVTSDILAGYEMRSDCGWRSIRITLGTIYF